MALSASSVSLHWISAPWGLGSHRVRLLLWQQQPGHKSHTPIHGLRRGRFSAFTEKELLLWDRYYSLLTSLQCPSVLTKQNIFDRVGEAYAVSVCLEVLIPKPVGRSYASSSMVRFRLALRSSEQLIALA